MVEPQKYNDREFARGYYLERILTHGGLMGRAHSIVFLLLLSACGVNAERYDRSYVSGQLEERTGRGLGPGSKEPAVPEGVDVGDGLSEEEAVAVALWNNAAFQEALTQLGFARADLVQAGMLPNPVLSVLFPLGPKQLEFAAKLPLEFLLLRPKRIAAAEFECERVSALLVQGGLDLIREVKKAYAELLLARRAAAVAREESGLRARMAEVFDARLRAGDVSDFEAGHARVEALRGGREAARRAREEEVARERLAELLGLPREQAFALSEPLEPRGPVRVSVEELLPEAYAARPDLRAAEYAMEAAAERAGLAALEIFALSGVVDANDRRGKDGLEVGPGAEAPVPLFNWNGGGRARAEAEVERAGRHYLTVRRKIAREVAEAALRYREAREAREAWEARILPALETALRQTEKAQENGEISILPVLETAARLVEARLRSAEAEADLRRARADLERSVGRRLGPEVRK